MFFSKKVMDHHVSLVFGQLGFLGARGETCLGFHISFNNAAAGTVPHEEEHVCLDMCTDMCMDMWTDEHWGM